MVYWYRDNKSDSRSDDTRPYPTLFSGTLTVEVIDILSPGNTCSSIATFTIADDLPVFTINAAHRSR